MKFVHPASRFLVVLMLPLFFMTCSSVKLEHTDWSFVAGGFQFPEGPAWNQDEQVLYLSNCHSDWIASIAGTEVDTLIRSLDSTFIKTNGLIFSPEGYIVGCDFGIGKILKISTEGHAETLISGYQNQPFNRPNDIIMDKQGNIYFTDPKGYDPSVLDGRLFYFDMRTSELKLAADSLAFPNGLEISPVDGRLYVCESALHRIVRFDIESDGSLHHKSLFVELQGGDPDGLEFDVNGNLYVAHFGGKAIFIISPSGEILQKIDTPGSRPSNIEFAGTDMKTVFITEDETNSVYKMTVNIPGHSWY
ncbi:SMP-30/gluconolactonase/LRE family protein [candidate division KSB1 bacterium]|nr:SMP-30/gluconolactonase/LRE family protein [candidate division KSB1 bacterium]